MKVPFQYNRSQWISPGQTIELITIEKIGSGKKIVVTGLANYSSDASSWGNVEFKIICDGMQHIEFGSFYDSIGSQEILRSIPVGFLEANQSLKVIIKNNHSTDTYKIGFTLEGYFDNL